MHDEVNEQKAKLLPNGENFVVFLQFLEWSLDNEEDVRSAAAK